MNPAQAGQNVRPYLVGLVRGTACTSATSLAPVTGGEL